MADKEQIRILYEEAVYLHLVHTGRKAKRGFVKINWND